jgi:hypothetical protein
VSIDGVRYVDGGAHSPTNADLFAGLGLDLVVVSSPMSVVGRPLRADLGSRRLARYYLAREAAEIRREGTPVITFEPTREDLGVMGLNAMDGSRTAEIVARAHESARRRLARPDAATHLAALAGAAGRDEATTILRTVRLVPAGGRPVVPDGAGNRVGGRRNGKARDVERRSVQHGARLDDEMAHEVAPLTHGAPEESRAREDLEHEPPADGEPFPDALVVSHDARAPGALGHDDLELRSDIARHLRLSAFPAPRDALLAVAQEEGASLEVLALLATLPADVEFRQVSEVWHALGGAEEHREEAPGPAPAAGLPDTGEGAAAPAPASAAVPFEPARADDAAAGATPVGAGVPSGAGRAEAPGCNVAAVVGHAIVEATAGAARTIRRVVPFA